jgi:hypothetical protein
MLCFGSVSSLTVEQDKVGMGFAVIDYTLSAWSTTDGATY